MSCSLWRADSKSETRMCSAMSSGVSLATVAAGLQGERVGACIVVNAALVAGMLCGESLSCCIFWARGASCLVGGVPPVRERAQESSLSASVFRERRGASKVLKP